MKGEKHSGRGKGGGEGIWRGSGEGSVEVVERGWRRGGSGDSTCQRSSTSPSIWVLSQTTEKGGGEGHLSASQYFTVNMGTFINNR